jgi:hypothetical protein
VLSFLCLIVNMDLRMVSIDFGKAIFLLILIAASTVLIPFLNQNQIGLAQQQTNQTS